MNSDRDTRCRVGCPIRTSRDHRSLASPPGFSQRATSFIASQCQGIHQMPFSALDPRRFRKETPYNTAAHRGKPPHKAASHEDTFSDTSSASAPGVSPRSHDKLSLHPSISIPPGSPGRCLFSFSEHRTHRRVTPVVEVPNGGGERNRTDDLLLAKQALSQLSYTPFQGSETGIRDQFG